MITVTADQAARMMEQMLEMRRQRAKGAAYEGSVVHDVSSHFPFTALQVQGIHISRRGSGPGVWFRLQDGRVFDIHGVEQSSDVELYDNDGE